MITNNFIYALRTVKKMNSNTDKNELKPTEAYEPVEEGYDEAKERKSHIGWALFFGIMFVLIVSCVIVIVSLS